MDKLKELISLCRASITISVNDHKDNYESVSKYMANMVLLDDELIEYIGEDVFAEMIKRDTIVYVIAYPRSSVGSYQVYHYDVETAIERVLNAVKSELN